MQDWKQASDLPCGCPGASPSVVPCPGTVVPGVKMYSFCTVWLLDVSAAARGDGAYTGTFQGYYT